MTLAQFNRDLKRVVRNLERKVIPQAVTKIALDAFSEVVKRTPVDRGQHRASWQIGINRPADGEVKALDASAGGSNTVTREVPKLFKLPPYPIVHITNNAPAIEILEDGGFQPKNPGPSKDRRKGRFGRVLVKDGYSVQAPRGMVKVTVARLQRLLLPPIGDLEKQ